MQCSLLCQSFKFINTGHEIENSKLNLKKTFFFFLHRLSTRLILAQQWWRNKGELWELWPRPWLVAAPRSRARVRPSLKKCLFGLPPGNFLTQEGGRDFYFFTFFFKLNLSNIGKKKNKIKISIEEVLYVVANKILSAGYFNEAGVDSKQTTILLWLKFSNEYLLC